MRRKVIKQRDSYTITLPKKWVKHTGVDSHPEIDLEIQEGNLVIESVEKKDSKKNISIDLHSGYGLFINHVITNAYRLGYDKINLSLKDEHQLEEIESAISKTMGFEITDSGNKSCNIENITEPSEDKSTIIARRMFLMIKKMLENIQKKEYKMEDLKKTESKIDKYTYFSRRMLSKEQDLKQAPLEWLLISNILLMNHSTVRMAENLDKPSEELSNMLKEASTLFDNLYHAYFEKNLKILSKVHENGEELLYNKIMKYFDKKDADRSVYHLAELVRLILISASPITGIIMMDQEEHNR